MNDPRLLSDPVFLHSWMWPHSWLYSKQREFLWAVKESVETFCVAGNELGKDFILGRTCLMFWHSPWTFFPRRYFGEVYGRDDVKRLALMRGCQVRELPEYIVHQRRIVTTSVKADHLRVLWGEIGNAWRTCAIDLSAKYVQNDMDIRFKEELQGAMGRNVNSYLTGMVSGADNMEALTGHHAPYNLACGDEASGLDNQVYEAFDKWARRRVYIGNPKPCNNFFKKNFLAGDLSAPGATRGAA